MADQAQELHILLAVFDRANEATEAMDRLRRMASDGIIELRDAATVRRDADLSVRVTEMVGPSGGKDTQKGAIAGGVLGLMFPPSVLVGAVVGIATGGIYGRFRDSSIKNADLEKSGESLRPGQSALVSVVRDRFVDLVSSGVRGYVRLDEYRIDTETGAIVAV